MHSESLRAYCLAKPGTTEELPFDAVTLVYKVMGKMYALHGLERLPAAVNLKCNPERAEELRASYAGIQPGYHMSKKHWNTIRLEEDVEDDLIRELIDHSYDLVVSKLRKADREALRALGGDR